MTNPVAPLSNAAPTPEAKPRNLAEAARQFEALLLTQILKAVSDPQTITGEEPDAASRTALDMAQEQFASALAANGGLGLARMISASVRAPDTGA